MTYKGEVLKYNWKKNGLEMHLNPNGLPTI